MICYDFDDSDDDFAAMILEKVCEESALLSTDLQRVNKVAIMDMDMDSNITSHSVENWDVNADSLPKDTEY